MEREGQARKLNISDAEYNEAALPLNLWLKGPHDSKPRCTDGLGGRLR